MCRFRSLVRLRQSTLQQGKRGVAQGDRLGRAGEGESRDAHEGAPHKNQAAAVRVKTNSGDVGLIEQPVYMVHLAYSDTHNTRKVTSVTKTDYFLAISLKWRDLGLIINKPRKWIT